MVDSDYLMRGIFTENHIRFAFADITGTANFGIVAHDTDPLAAELFTGAMMVGALVSPLLTGAERYSFRWEYSGKLKHILVDVNADGDLRGLISPPHLMNQVNNDKDIWGNDDGFISVIKSCEGAVLNSGKSRTAFNEPVADAGFFFSISDQIETEFSVAMEFCAVPDQPVKIASGFMLQAMPGCDLNIFDRCRQIVISEEFANLLIAKMPSEKKLRVLAAKIIGSDDLSKISYSYGNSPGFRCNCTREKMYAAMSILGRAELAELFRENSQPGICCNFCRQQYRFSAGDFGITI